MKSLLPAHLTTTRKNRNPSQSAGKWFLPALCSFWFDHRGLMTPFAPKACAALPQSTVGAWPSTFYWKTLALRFGAN